MPFLLILSLFVALPSETVRASQLTKYVENELIVQFSSKASERDKIAVSSQVGAISRKQISSLARGLELLKFKSNQSVESLVKALENNSKVDFAEPNYKIKNSSLPNDPQYLSGAQSNLKAPAVGSDPTYGINAEGAWQSGFTGNRDKVYVAVLDEGIDINHEDLRDNIWINDSITPGLDGSGDPFYGQVSGWDFVGEDSIVLPASAEENHGTHVAGIIGAKGNNGVGMAGVAWDVGIIPVRILSGTQGSIASAIAGLDYVTALRTQKGIPIVATNNSYTFQGAFSEALRAAIQRGGDAGIIFVAAAGNDGVDNDSRPNFPSNYQCQTGIRPWNCVVAVASTSPSGALSYFSDYGEKLVTLAAPGENVLSTFPGNNYGRLSGTSMSAPLVTGAIALCLAANRSMSAPSILNALSSTSTKVSILQNKLQSGGILNAAGLVSTCFSQRATFTGNPTEIVADPIYTERIQLRWNPSMTGEAQQQIEIASGPDGCQSSFSHLAFIGPGLNSFPVYKLKESEFYCFRIRGMLDTQTSNFTKSNLTITWSSNLPFISGNAYMADGKTPVSNLKVMYQLTSCGDFNAGRGCVIKTIKTDSNGFYALQVQSGVEGQLWLEAYDQPGVYSTSPKLPMGMYGGERITVTQDTVVNLIMPPVVESKVKVVDDIGPIAGATVKIVGLIGTNGCLAGGENDPYHHFFQGTRAWTNPSTGCSLNRGGYQWIFTADSSGEVTIITPPNVKASIEAQHPIDKARVKTSEFQVGPEGSQSTFTINVPNSLFTISGNAYMADGKTPVSNLKVMYQLTSCGDFNAGRGCVIKTIKTDSNGFYALQVQSGVEGQLWLEAYDQPGVYSTSPKLPMGMYGGERITVTQDTVVNLIMPPVVESKVKVVDDIGPIAGATVKIVGLIGTNGCLAGGENDPYHHFFQGTRAWTNPSTGCSLNRGGYQWIFTADSSGEVTIITPPNVKASIEAQHPIDKARVKTSEFQVGPEGSQSTFTINVPNSLFTISGNAYMADGKTPVSNLKVMYQLTSCGDFNAGRGCVIKTIKTDSNGFYALQVQSGVEGQLWLEAYDVSPTTGAGVYSTSPKLPMGMYGGERITVTQDTVVNLIMPPVVESKVKVVDDIGPIAGATVKIVGLIGTNGCLAGGENDPYHHFFQGTRAWTNPSTGCSLNRGGYQWIFTADSSGEVTIITPPNVKASIEAQHPIDKARVKTSEFQVGPEGSQSTFTINVPGTPNVPKRPEAIPLSGTIQLNWVEPYDGGAFIDYYNVYQALNIDGPYTLTSAGTCAGNIEPTLRSCTVTGLTDGVPYYFAIIAHNVVGYSGRSLSTVAIPLDPKNSTGYAILTDTPISLPNSFSVNVVNYSSSMNYEITSSSGNVVRGTPISNILPITVSGLLKGESATLSIVATCTSCTPSAKVVDGIAIDSLFGTALNPIFSTPTSTADGFSVSITNYDPAFTWATPSVSAGSVAITSTNGATRVLTVTGLSAGSSATITQTTSRTGYANGSATVTGSATTGTALNPIFGTPTSTADGFSVSITNYDPAFTWATPSVSAGSVAITSTNGATRVLTVTGLSAGSSATITQTTSRTGYANGSATVTGSATTGTALNPIFGTPTSTADGFSVSITNYDPAFTWATPSVSAGSVAITSTNGATRVLTVTGLSAGSSATITQTTSRTGYANGSATVTGSATTGTALNPIFGTPTSTADGFSVSITNYDPAFTWATPSVSAGSVAITSTNGATRVLTVTGLSAGSSATITQTTSRTGYANGSATVTGSATTGTALNPIFGTPTSTADGFSVSITNYDPAFTWATPSVSAGSVAITSTNGATRVLTVTGLSAGSSATITQTTSRTGYANGSATVTGGAIALPASPAPTYSTPISTATGFTVNVTNYNSTFTYTTTVNVAGATVTRGRVNGTTLPLTIAGFTPGQSGVLTVVVSRTSYTSASATVTGSATQGTALTPTFSTPVSTATGFTVNVTNYNSAYTFTPTITSGAATVTRGTASGTTLPLTISGVNFASATVLVTTNRTGYQNGSASLSRNALPVITSISQTSAPIGTAISITGTNLWGATSVKIGSSNKAITKFTVISPTQVIINTAAAATGAISLVTPGGTATGPNMTISSTRNAAGAISMSAATGGAGSAIVLTGTNLGAATAVTRGATNISFRVIGLNQIVLAIPSGLATGTFSVTTPAGTVSSASFTASATLVPPTITSGAQNLERGMIVTLNGSNIGAISSMTFNGSAITDFVVSASGSVLIRIPANATLGPANITIASAGGSVSTNTVTVI